MKPQRKNLKIFLEKLDKCYHLSNTFNISFCFILKENYSRLVFDRETGKPKGYGFCEYRDQETALSAMRNLNGYEIGGRNLRVDNACTEKSRMEMQNLLNQPPVENPYGEPIQAEKAPEAISKAVASLPPEQMFELMKQMKLCIQVCNFCIPLLLLISFHYNFLILTMNSEVQEKYGFYY